MTLFKRYWYLFVFILLLVVGLIFEALTRPRPPVSDLPLISDYTYLPLDGPYPSPPPNLQVIYSGPHFSIPAQLPLHSATPPDSSAFAATLANTLSLKPHSQINTLWQNDTITLSYFPDRGTFQLNYLAPPPPAPGITLDQAYPAAESYLNSLGISPVIFNKNGVILADDSSEFYNPNPQNNLPPAKASFAFIPFTPSLDGYPLLLNTLDVNSQNVIIDSSNQVSRVTLAPPINSQPIGLVNSLPLKLVLERIKQGQATITFLYSPGAPPSVESLARLNLQAGRLEYRLNPQSNQIEPYYSFAGTGSTTNNDTYDLQLITPAF